MRQQAKVNWILMLAAGAVVAGATSVGLAQYQIENSTGRLLDANNRLGSDGVNDARRVTGGYSADDIVYGNVTRGRQFRGNVNSTDPTAFRGNISRPSDNLARDAGMSVYQRGANYNPADAQRYYGDQRGVNAPPDFGRLQPGSVGAFQVSRPTYRVPGDVRLDATIPNPQFGVAPPIQYMIPGLTPSSPNALTFSPLSIPLTSLGEVRQDDVVLPTRDLLRRLNLDESRLREMREEYQRLQQIESQQAAPHDVTLAPETPINDPMNAQLASAVASGPLEGSVNTQQSLRQRLLTAAPAAERQNTQYAALRSRLERFRRQQGMTDEEANREFMREWNQAQEQERQQGTPAVTVPQEQVSTVPQQVLPQRSSTESAEDDDLVNRRQRYAIQAQQPHQPEVEGILPPQPELPIRIASFAEGVQATGLKNLLRDAEQAMQQGKYTQALDYYDAAAVVAPDNSMVLMGRAIAELGAGYYTRAQTDMEQVMQADPALLMARYDLKAFFGDDRLQYIVRDLKDLAQNEPRQSRPLFLLAFIAYSTESKQRTVDYLNIAEQRGGNKQFYDQLREYWGLNEKEDKPGTRAPQRPAGQQ